MGHSSENGSIITVFTVHRIPLRNHAKNQKYDGYNGAKTGSETDDEAPESKFFYWHLFVEAKFSTCLFEIT